MITHEYTIPGLHIRDHTVSVPLDWSAPESSPTLQIFAREIVDPTRREHNLPLLVFLQGGPGGKSPRPVDRSGWLGEALTRFRVILYDQRGTGRSARIQARDMERFADGDAAAEYLLHFRADSIVRDLEHLRLTEFGGVRWHTLGQSYGGFLTLSYLSMAPEGVAASYITGGLPGLSANAEEVYRRTFPRTTQKNREFYSRYPHLEKRVAGIAEYLETHDVRLPDGDRLTVKRLQTLGFSFGAMHGADTVHWLLDEAWGGYDASVGLSDAFLTQVMTATGYDQNPLYAVLHESIYGSGPGATQWAAQRVREEHSEYEASVRPLFFTGEMIFPWMFEEIRSLRGFRDAADALAQRTDYSPLYDHKQLANNEVPVAAAIYDDDMYVDAGLSKETAHTVKGLTPWVTNEFEHDGIASGRVVTRLFDLVDERGGPLS
ncbi:alpha/beta fold hydrolase [Lysinibacter sp. HNR]|uniref:alpha/beta fold hydrolase n=1 Tax=Lysinibacter sp. HNR TaxID=3031408 RepID=UPI0024354E54|nr:alpha/beta fold hydrolase [Lysinibacter sp. HNR]WGD37654.1 alpha/beta fold hydrolase [Lysinibacter sp. HNR]